MWVAAIRRKDRGESEAHSFSCVGSLRCWIRVSWLQIRDYVWTLNLHNLPATTMQFSYAQLALSCSIPLAWLGKVFIWALADSWWHDQRPVWWRWRRLRWGWRLSHSAFVDISFGFGTPPWVSSVLTYTLNNCTILHLFHRFAIWCMVVVS